MVSLLNGGEGLSKDRLRRVQMKGAEASKQSSELISTQLIETRAEIGLFSDISLLIRDKGKAPRFKLGRVLRMRMPGKRGKIEYSRPVPLNENDKYGYVELRVGMYKETCGEYIYQPDQQLEFTLWNVLMGVKLTYNSNTNKYCLPNEERDILIKFVEDEIKQKCKNTKTQKDNSREMKEMVDDGRRVTVVGPATNKSGQRTSGRVRKVVHFL